MMGGVCFLSADRPLDLGTNRTVWHCVLRVGLSTHRFDLLVKVAIKTSLLHENYSFLFAICVSSRPRTNSLYYTMHLGGIDRMCHLPDHSTGGFPPVDKANVGHGPSLGLV
jgi:hypothetical protein